MKVLVVGMILLLSSEAFAQEVECNKPALGATTGGLVGHASSKE